MYTGNSSTPTAILDNNTTSASSSAAGADLSLSGNYEVFLSFCGKDTRKGFTDYLYTSLEGAGVRTFRDDNELRVGEEIGPELLKAIKDSKISIPIFSKNYASSKWCLLELAQMVECEAEAKGEKMIFPIFYDVDPHDVRHQSGSYEEAFRQHEKKKRLDEKTVQSWKKALTKVGQLKGLELEKETGGHEGKLAKIVVEKVLLDLEKNYTHEPKNLVGMDGHMKILKRLLKFDSNSVRIIGIYGMGGLGKTTLAKVIYNQLCQSFEGHCFLDDVRENSRPRSRIVNLQNKLISKVRKSNVQEFSHFNEGRSKIEDVVRGKKVLIILDDVDESFQIDMLMGHQSWFGAGSRIIITSRDKNVLDEIEKTCQTEDLLDVYESYQPSFMDDHHALKLFSKYAFRRDSPTEGYEKLSKEIVSIAAGLPLVLMVLGSTFFVVKDEDLWEEKLRKLRVIPPKEVLEKLRFSFEELEDGQKQIFLDIACMFIGCDKTYPCLMWEDCEFFPKGGIHVLVSRSLITVDYDNNLRMHDQLRDLGRYIVREQGLNEPRKRSRLWGKEAIDILEAHQGTSSVEALCLPYEVFGYEGFGHRLDAQNFHDLRNLRYLTMNSMPCDLDGDFKNIFSNLRWLEWEFAGKLAPTNLHLKNLVILNLSWSEFTENWEGWSQFKMAKKLKVLHLSWCSKLRVVPHLSTFASLERLKLWNSSLCRLDGLEQLKSLRYLDASFCCNLETLPSLSNLTNLVELKLKKLERLIEIQGLEKLESLQVLDIGRCSSLERLPTISNFKRLKIFKAYDCSKLIGIEGLHRLNSLETLNLGCCDSLKGVPDLGRLESLEFLSRSHHEILQVLSNFKKSRQLDIASCEKLIEFQGVDWLESLKFLNISECRSLKRLLDLSCFKGLKELDISSSNQLTEIQGLDKLESLESLDISGCESIEALPDLSNLEKLRNLDANGCVKLAEIQGLDKLESLEDLSISRCESIEALPDLSNLEKLIQLYACGCVKLAEIRGLEKLKSLTTLAIGGCKALRNIPDLPNTEIDRGYLGE